MPAFTASRCSGRSPRDAPATAPFATLVRSTFDEALPYFADGSIDLLHIDGRHGYEDVKHDYLTWAGKLSSNAIVLLHDVNVRERGFGVWRFFDELSAARASFRFDHGHGLGVLAAGSAVPPGLAPLFAAPPETADLIRAVYSALGGALGARQRLAQRDRDAAALRNLLAEHHGTAEATLARVRKVLGLATVPVTTPDGTAPVPPADTFPDEPSTTVRGKARRRTKPQVRLTAGE